MINAAWLETFTSFCETGSLTRTAERLHMTQPGVSQHLKKLEAQVGRPLVRREGRRFSLTSAGERLRDLGLARRREEQRVLDGIREDDPDAGSVALACAGGFALALYPRLIAHAAPRPELVLALEAAPQKRIFDGMLEGRFDLGVLHQEPRHPRLARERIGREELCLVLPASFGRVRPTFDALEGLGFIAHPDGAELADRLLAENYPGEYVGGDRLRRRGYVNQIGQIPAPVAAGAGYTVLPRSAVAAYPERHRLTIAPLEHRVHQPLWLVSRRSPELARRVRHVAAIVRAAAEALTGDAVAT